MPQFMCPSCHQENEVEWEDLPERAADDIEYECKLCNQKITIGWVAEVEVRSVTM